MILVIDNQSDSGWIISMKTGYELHPVLCKKNHQYLLNEQLPLTSNHGGRRGRDPMVVGFTTTYATNAYHH